MQLICKLEEVQDDLHCGAVSIGNFDGVHRGHVRIVERLIEKARQCGGPSVVFTFDPHPVRILRPELAPPPLTWTRRKAEMLAELGVDAVIAYPTDAELLELNPQQFFDWIVCQTLQAKAMVEGPNFCFGNRREGNIDVLRSLCDKAGVVLEVVDPLQEDGEYVSSSRVRRLIAHGDVRAASQLLARPYRIRGMVSHGVGRGAKIGYPTANVCGVDTLLPADGVYAGRGSSSAKSWPAAINLGPNPTFGEDQAKVEVHLIGYEGSLYDMPLEVDFLARLRDIQPFASVDALREQLGRDVEAVRQTV